MLHWLGAFLMGLLARWITPGREPAGCLVTGFLGIGGSLLASWAGERPSIDGTGEGAGVIASVIGAVAILLIYRVLRGGPDQ